MNDRITVRTVVFGLVAAVLLCIVGVVVLALHGTDIPEILKAIALTALGAVAGVLAKTGTDVQPVAVVNKPADPVPTADVPAKRKRR